MEWIIFWVIVIVINAIYSNTKKNTPSKNTVIKEEGEKVKEIQKPLPKPEPVDPELVHDRNRLKEWIQKECSAIINANTSKHLFPNKKLLEIGYSDLLNTNEWKFKRNKILIRDGYTCTVCRSMSRSLHVHHKCYIQDE